jgi:hypothetical protein
MSEIDHEKLREDVLAHILENDLAGTREEAEALLSKWEEQFAKELWLLAPEARLRSIASQKCGIQVISSEPVGEGEAEARTIESLIGHIPEYNLVIDALVKQVKVRETKGGKKVADLVISDGTATSRIALWEDEAEAVDQGEIREGEVIRITGAYSAESYGNYYPVEIKKSKAGAIHVDPEDPRITETEASQVSDLGEGLAGIKFTGKVNNIFELKRTKTGKDYLTMRMSDRNGDSIFVKVWNSDLAHAIDGPRVNQDDIITLTDLRVDSWKGNLGLNTTDMTELEFEDGADEEEFPEPTGAGGSTVEKHLVVAEAGDRLSFVGRMVRIYPGKPYYDSCPSPDCKKGVKVRVVQGRTEQYCPKGCQEALTQEPVPMPRVSGLISDGTAVLRFTALGEPAGKIIGLEPEQIKEEFDALYEGSSETDDWKKIKDASKIFTEAFEDRMLEGFAKIAVSVNLDEEYRGNIELMVNSLEEVDYDLEAQAAREKILELAAEPGA